jgi:hypothetical protein
MDVPKCSGCGRERTMGGAGSEHPMDAYDYSPLQVLTGSAVGWYSGDDGELCPEEMQAALNGQV